MCPLSWLRSRNTQPLTPRQAVTAKLEWGARVPDRWPVGQFKGAARRCALLRPPGCCSTPAGVTVTSRCSWVRLACDEQAQQQAQRGSWPLQIRQRHHRKRLPSHRLRQQQQRRGASWERQLQGGSGSGSGSGGVLGRPRSRGAPPVLPGPRLAIDKAGLLAAQRTREPRAAVRAAQTSAACLQRSTLPYLGSAQALAPLELAGASASLPGLPLSARHAPQAASGLHGVETLLVYVKQTQLERIVDASVLMMRREVDEARTAAAAAAATLGAQSLDVLQGAPEMPMPGH
jgi:hypothetical protein